ncbi:MAG: hypothetical protein QXN55_00690 [Candidatus Nitrosotenuis sp.]
MKVKELLEGFWEKPERAGHLRSQEKQWRDQTSGADPTKPEWAVTDKNGKTIRKHITKAAASALVKDRTDWKSRYGQLYVKAMVDL